MDQQGGREPEASGEAECRVRGQGALLAASTPARMRAPGTAAGTGAAMSDGAAANLAQRAPVSSAGTPHAARAPESAGSSGGALGPASGEPGAGRGPRPER